MTPAADSTRAIPEPCDVRFLRWERNVAVLFALMMMLSAIISWVNAEEAKAKENRLREQPVRSACEIRLPS